MNFEDVYLDVKGNKYTTFNGPFCFRVLNRNISNIIKNYELDIIPDNNMIISSFAVILGSNEFVSYSVFYSTYDNKNNFIPLFTNINTNINLTNLNIDKLYCIKIIAPFFNICDEFTTFLFRGNISNNSKVNIFLKENNNIIKGNLFDIYIADIFSMRLKLNFNNSFFKISIDSNNYVLKNPIVGILLPFNLEEYYFNNEKYELVDLINNNSIFNVDNEFDKNMLPSIDVINNYNNSSRMLIKYTFTNFILSPDFIFNIYIKVKVNNNFTADVFSFNDNLSFCSYFNKLY